MNQWYRRINVYVMMAAVVVGIGVSVAGLVWGLDVADITNEWTPDGKRLAMERAKLPTKDEMVKIPAGEFLMGSSKQVDRNSYQPELPQRRVYLDAYEIDKYEVTALHFLKFVLATDRPPLIDWRYEGGNFQESMMHHPVMHVSWHEAEAYCQWAGKRLPDLSPQPSFHGERGAGGVAVFAGDSLNPLAPSLLREAGWRCCRFCR